MAEPPEIRHLRLENAALNEQRELTTQQLRARHREVRQVLDTALIALERPDLLDDEMRAELVAIVQLAVTAVPEQLDYTCAHLEQAERGASALVLVGAGVLAEATRVADELRAAAESAENIGRMVRVVDLARELSLIE